MALSPESYVKCVRTREKEALEGSAYDRHKRAEQSETGEEPSWNRI